MYRHRKKFSGVLPHGNRENFFVEPAILPKEKVYDAPPNWDPKTVEKMRNYLPSNIIFQQNSAILFGAKGKVFFLRC